MGDSLPPMSLPKASGVPRLALLVTAMAATSLLGAGPGRTQPLPTPSRAPVDSSKVLTTTVGSLEPGVYFDDIGFTARRSWNNTISVSPHDPETAYVGSFDGYIWKTTDGGRTWTERRLIQETKAFYGDSGERIYFGVHRRGSPAWGEKHAGGSPSTSILARGRSKLLRYRPKRVGISAIRPGAGSRLGAAANVNFGVGISGGAPRMQTVVRKFTYARPTYLGMYFGSAGLNIKQTLIFRGWRPTEVRRVVFHPTDPKIVFAATFFGLFQTYDGGLNWVRTFQGTNPKETMLFHVAVNPADPRQVLLATGNGMYASNDGGKNFMKSTAQGIGEGLIGWLEFYRHDPRYVFACTSYGVLRSADGGKTWAWIYFTTFPLARITRHISIDPFDGRRGYVATHDGIFTIENAFTGSLENWKRLGGLRFTANEVWKVSACPKHKGHLWVLTNTRLPMADPYRKGSYDAGGAFIWESIDGGKSWKVIYSGHTSGSIQWFVNAPDDPDLLWIAWSRALIRMRRRTSAPLPPTRYEQRKLARTMAELPPISEVFSAVSRFTGVHADQRLRYRQRARLRALVPRLDASFTYYRFRDYPLLHDGVYFTLPFRFNERLSYHFHEFRVMATWDLSNLVFDLQDALFGRVARINGELEAYMLHSVQRIYGELRRLQGLMATAPPDSLRVRLMYRLRMSELASYIDLFSGGYLTRWRKGGRPSADDTPWFDHQPGIDRWFNGANR